MLVAAAWLAGCAVGPVNRPDVPLPATWRNAPAAEGAPAPDLRSWWKAFDDATLDQLVEQALADNLTIRQAAARIEGARTLDRHAYAGFLPEIGAHTFAEPAPDSSASYFQIGFDAKWELGLFGRAESRSRIAAAGVGEAFSDLQAARVSVVAEVARSYVELRGAQQRLDLLGKLVSIMQDKVDLIATRQRLRLATGAELDAARAEQAKAEAALAEPRLAIARSRQQIAVLLGKAEPDTSLETSAPPPGLGALRITDAPADLLRTRPEIQRAEAEVLKAAGELGLARADLYPRLGLGGSLTYAARVIGNTRLADADHIVTFGPLIDIPLFDWGARRAVADAREADLRASVYAYRQAVLDGVAEAENALATFDEQGRRRDALTGGVAHLEQGAASTATLRRLGLADGFDRAAAKGAVLQAQLELSQAEQERSIAFIALYKALGGAPLPATNDLARSAPVAAAGDPKDVR